MYTFVCGIKWPIQSQAKQTEKFKPVQWCWDRAVSVPHPCSIKTHSQGPLLGKLYLQGFFLPFFFFLPVRVLPCYYNSSVDLLEYQTLTANPDCGASVHPLSLCPVYSFSNSFT